MAIPTPPAAPNPLGANFAAEALAFTQWMHTAAPEFNTAVNDANAAVGDAEQAVLDAAAQAGLATTNGAAQVALAVSQATLATTSATTATTQAGIATTKAGVATTQAGIATSAAATATTQAGIATTKAAEAAASAASIAGGPVPEAPSDGKTYVRKDSAWSEIIPLTLNNLPALRPSLLLDFANSKQVDPRITFTRASTATYYDAQGVLRTADSGVPRIDHDPVTGECKGLLIEEARTNLTVNSQVATSSIGTAVTPNAALAPDGTMSMDFIYEDTTTGEHYAGDRNYAVAAGTTYCFSVFIKDGGLAAATRYQHRIAEAATASFLFNPTTQVISELVTISGYVDHGVIPCGNGVFRVWITYTAQTSTSAINRSQLYNTVVGPIYTGDGASGIYIWGTQLEEGAFPSSYIPTTTAAVTRAAEIAYITQDKLQAFTKPNSGTVFAEYSIQGFSKTTIQVYSAATMGVEGGDYAVRLRSYSDTFGQYDSDAIVLYPGYPFDSDSSKRTEAGIKISSAISYGSKGATASAFGEFKGTNTTPFAPTQHSIISLGNTYNTEFLNGHIRRVSYFPAELSATELNALTAV